MSKKKIAFIISAPITAKAFLLKHFEVLANEFDITLVANFESEEDFNIPFVVQTKNIQIQRKISLLKDLLALFQLYFFLKKNKFDSIHTVTPKAGLLGIVASWLAGIPVRIHIFTGQVWHTSNGIKKIFLMFLDKVVVLLSTHILVDGYPQKIFLEENKILRKGGSIVLGNGSICGVDCNRFKPSLNIRKKVRDNLGFNDIDFVYGFLGRLNRDKGVLELLDAFKKIDDEISNVKLLLIGFDEENFSSKIEKLNNITFVGSTNVPEIILQAVDVFCLPSHREAFGLSVLEASALQIPVVCSNTYGLQDAVIENETGLVHKVHDYIDLYDKMKYLYQNSEIRDKLGKKGRVFVEEKFSSQFVTNEWLKFYNNTLSNVR